MSDAGGAVTCLSSGQMAVRRRLLPCACLGLFAVLCWVWVSFASFPDDQLRPDAVDRAAFQPQSALSDMEFASVVSSYRGPGNSDRRRTKELPIILWWSTGLFPHFPGDTERIDCGASSCLATSNRKVDSYGKCLNNKPLPEHLEDTSTATGEEPRFMHFVARYKFHLALENGLCPDYMTEKLWRPLHQGCVPVYRGSPVVADWMPNDHTAVVIDDFPSPKALADFLKRLDEDDEEYVKYLEFKDHRKISNTRLLEALESREWGVNDMSKPNYLNGFECYLCDQENARIAAERAHRKEPKQSPPPRARMASNSHMGCPLPSPGYGNVEDLPANDGWLQIWPQDYWQSLDQAEGLESLIRLNESDPSLLWKHIQNMAVRRARGKH